MVSHVFIVVVTTVLVFLSIETIRYHRHQKNLWAIPIRIHINGSRGKSSVTRLVGAVIRASGKTTITKTTGTAPRFILPDGTELPIFRPGKPNIIEQLKVVHAACHHKAEVLIVECMAVTPEYIDIVERKIIRSSIGIMTNVREDHLDVMGPTVYHAALSMAQSLPYNGIAFTSELHWFEPLRQVAQKRGTKLYHVSADIVNDDDLVGFPYLEHKDNVAIALVMARYFDVPRQTALEAMYRAQPDPGVLRETGIVRKSGICYFFNALAANDPDSSKLIFDMVCKRRKGVSVAVVILRSDRIQRTEQFGNALGSTICADHYLIAGSGVGHVMAKLRKKEIAEQRCTGLENPTAEEVARALLRITRQTMVVTAMGNIVGLGDKFVTLMERMARRSA
ncbi:MAG: poly-gamma-glutamate synthase PgsB [Chitinivibrionales bacterium]|nr:poly-gamma-glutamate synthase PgsB [Chitinivibrionales bacterium]